MTRRGRKCATFKSACCRWRWRRGATCCSSRQPCASTAAARTRCWRPFSWSQRWVADGVARKKSQCAGTRPVASNSQPNTFHTVHMNGCYNYAQGAAAVGNSSRRKSADHPPLNHPITCCAAHISIISRSCPRRRCTSSRRWSTLSQSGASTTPRRSSTQKPRWVLHTLCVWGAG